MSKRDKKEATEVVAQEVTVTPVAVKVALAEQVLTMGPKTPKHRADHNGKAWAVIFPRLPAKASELAQLPEVKQCGGAKFNGALFLGYAIRRGWLVEQK